MSELDLLAVGFRPNTHFALWVYIIATPLGGLTLFAGYLLLSWAYQFDQGRSIWLMVGGLVVIIGLRWWNGDFTYSFVGAIVMLIKIAPEVKHLDTGRWGRNLMIVGVICYFLGFINYPLALPADVTETELTALSVVQGMGRSARKAERRERARLAKEGAAGHTDREEDDEEDEKPASTPPPPAVAVAAATPKVMTAAMAVSTAAAYGPQSMVVRNQADILREGRALKERERKLMERKLKLNTKDREAVQWLTEDIQRYNADQKAFHELAVRIDPKYQRVLEVALKSEPAPATAKKK